MGDIHTQIERRFGNENIVYVTGHSLGGALAAIFHAFCGGICPLHGFWRPSYAPYRLTHSCYTFGMPRYGNLSAIESLANPFHIYNELDIVPTIPPRFFGFEDALTEYCINSNAEIELTEKKGSFMQFIFKLSTAKGIREHDIEVYMSRTMSVRDKHKA